MITILMISAKMATLGLLEIKVFWNKSYDVMTSSMTSPTKFYHITQIYCRCGHVTKVTVAFSWEKLS